MGIDLLISDIDGTLVTPDKALTPAAIAAVKALDTAGIAFTVVSSRPPRGMASVVETLQVRHPFAAFNGGSLVTPDLKLISTLRLGPEAARKILRLLDERGIDAWVFADETWRLRDLAGPKVGRERFTVGFDPIVVDGFDDVIGRIDKIVGVSDDHPRLAAVEGEAQALLGVDAIAERSQPYYLDFTPPGADKGHAVRAICAQLGVPLARTAVIGDMGNDVAMFRVAGLAIAMGQAPDAVKAEAAFVTGPNTEDGFARAVERFILKQGP
jgi:Cof subfamily protein (haloacid dehalogenase superfamily)